VVSASSGYKSHKALSPRELGYEESSSRGDRHRLPTHERQRRREAADREGRVALPGAELLGGAPVRIDEQEVGVAQLAADGSARGMDGGRRRPLGLEGPAFGALGQDGSGAERLEAGALSAVGGFTVDLRHHRGGQLLPLPRREVLPAGEGRELQGFAGRVLIVAEVLAATAGEILPGAVEPPALQDLSLGQGLDAVDSRPVRGAFHQALFDPVAEDIPESRNLRLGLVADLDRLVPAPEDLLPPAGEPADLPRDLGVEVIHESAGVHG
jgi:hypothetical protein